MIYDKSNPPENWSIGELRRNYKPRNPRPAEPISTVSDIYPEMGECDDCLNYWWVVQNSHIVETGVCHHTKAFQIAKATPGCKIVVCHEHDAAGMGAPSGDYWTTYEITQGESNHE